MRNHAGLLPCQGQWNEDEHDGQTGDDRATQDLIDGGVDRRFFVFSTPQLQILSDPIEHNDRVGQGISGQCQERRYDKESDFFV